MKILVIDSDPRMQKALKRSLSDDYIVDAVSTAEQGEMLAYTTPYDVILLEMLLPDMDGNDLCRVFKTRLKDTPIIIMSSRASISDKEMAFNRGADDFLIKPVSPRELKARMKVAIRKRLGKDNDEILQVRSLRIDTKKRVVTYKNERIRLRKKEMQLLEYLISNRGNVVTKSEIMESVWDMNVNPFSNTIEVHVKRLREKLEEPYTEKYIETVHGIGYLLE